jgi:predicted Fe-Mo cluster-binding NifX family protein
MKLAIPSEAPGGLKAEVSPHFGHCPVFTLIDSKDGEIEGVGVLNNIGHAQGGCMDAVLFLKNAGVDALVAGGMGMRPLLGFQQVGIAVYFGGDARTAGDAARAVIEGRAQLFGPAQVCGGGGGECGPE